MSERHANRAYLLLGSNIEAEIRLPAAVRELERFGRIAAVSEVWETPPVGDADQPNFLNAAVLLETPQSAGELRLRVIPGIEGKLERTRDPGNADGPRTIDVDLILFNRDVVRIHRWSIPDPDLLRQAFVAVPVAELDPGAVHPETGETLSEIADRLRGGMPTMHVRPDVRLLAGGN